MHGTSHGEAQTPATRTAEQARRAPEGAGDQPGGDLLLAPPSPLALLRLQRLAGNGAVSALVQRSPLDGEPDDGAAPRRFGAGRGSTEELHAAIYGDSAAAHAPGPVQFLRDFFGRVFDWSAVRAPSPQVIRDWLTFYNLREPFNVLFPEPGECDLNMERTTTDAVTGLFLSEARQAHLTFDRAVVHDAVVARLNAYIVMHNRRAGISNPVQGPVEPGVPDPVLGSGGVRSPASAPAVAGGDRGHPPGARATSSTQLSMSVQANLTAHRDLRTGAVSTDPGSTQITGQVTLRLHQDGVAGVDLTLQGSVTFLLREPASGRISDLSLTDPPRVTSISNGQVAGQAAWVAPFFRNALQLQVFAQLVAGVNWSQVPAGTPVAVSSAAPLVMPRTQLDPMAQVAAGAQASYVIPGTQERVQFFVQGLGSLTASGQGVTADGQIAFGFQGNF